MSSFYVPDSPELLHLGVPESFEAYSTRSNHVDIHDFRLREYAVRKVDPVAYLLDVLPFTIDRVRFYRESNAESYRIKVGAGVIAFSELDRKFGIFYGANYKPQEGWPKMCAERLAMSRMLQYSASSRAFRRPTVLAIVVAGPAFIDVEGTLSTPTIHLCEPCRREISPEESIEDETMIISTDTPESDHNGYVYQIHNMRELYELHDKGNPHAQNPQVYDENFQAMWARKIGYAGAMYQYMNLLRREGLKPELPTIKNRLFFARVALEGLLSKA